MNTLDHLEEMGIPIVCDRWLTLPPNPDIVNADQLYESALGGKHAKRLGQNALSGYSQESMKNLPERGKETQIKLVICQLLFMFVLPGIILKRTKNIEHPIATSPNHSKSEQSSECDSLARSDRNSELSGEELQTAFRQEEFTKVNKEVLF